MNAARHLPASAYPAFPAYLPAAAYATDDYEVAFARTEAERAAIQRLRFEVFNLELGEGLEASFATGQDADVFDDVCHHLLVRTRSTGEVIGTYRLQTVEMADQAHGFYSQQEFDLGGVPEGIRAQSVEIGRACIAQAHRSLQVLYLLWRGLGMYLAHNRKRYLFGCCSLTSQSPEEGKAVMDYLAAHGHLHPTLRLPAQPACRCYPPGFAAPAHLQPKVPRLMRVYLNIGARVCSEPALDDQFKTIDYLVLFDVESLHPRAMTYFQVRP